MLPPVGSSRKAAHLLRNYPYICTKKCKKGWRQSGRTFFTFISTDIWIITFQILFIYSEGHYVKVKSAPRCNKYGSEIAFTIIRWARIQLNFYFNVIRNSGPAIIVNNWILLLENAR